MNEDTLNQIKEAAKQAYPNEMCGFYLLDDTFVQVENRHETPETHFKISSLDHFKHKDRIKYIVHSHCNNRRYRFHPLTPSAGDTGDMVQQRRSGVPWMIVATDGENTEGPIIYPRIPNNNYCGRIFIPYINDCFTIVQDYYQFEYGIQLSYPKDTKWTERASLDYLFANYINDYPFVEVKRLQDMQRGDILLVDNDNCVRSHLLINLDNNTILHQGAVSKVENISKFDGLIHKVYRYAS